MKPHIRFKWGRWQMDGWRSRETGYPMVALCHVSSLRDAIPYFREALREQMRAPEWKFSKELSRSILENMMANNAFFRRAAGIG